MSKKDYDQQFKLVLIGDTGVGKSCILLRFAEDSFTQSDISTIGVDFRFRTVKVEKQTIKLQIWDTAGQERFRTITSAYYRGADAIIMVFDVTNEDSFRHVNDWLEEVNRYAAEDTCKLLVGNKCDKEAERIVPAATAKEYADSLGVTYLETSAKDDYNIDATFLTMANELIAREAKRKTKSPNGQKLKSQVKSGSCC